MSKLKVFLSKGGRISSDINGCCIMDMETGETLDIGEIKDSRTILRWMRIFFPNMQVEQDSDGQVMIYTGIVEQ